MRKTQDLGSIDTKSEAGDLQQAALEASHMKRGNKCIESW